MAFTDADEQPKLKAKQLFTSDSNTMSATACIGVVLAACTVFLGTSAIAASAFGTGVFAAAPVRGIFGPEANALPEAEAMAGIVLQEEHLKRFHVLLPYDNSASNMTFKPFLAVSRAVAEGPAVIADDASNIQRDLKKAYEGGSVSGAFTKYMTCVKDALLSMSATTISNVFCLISVTLFLTTLFLSLRSALQKSGSWDIMLEYLAEMMPRFSSSQNTEEDPSMSAFLTPEQHYEQRRYYQRYARNFKAGSFNPQWEIPIGPFSGPITGSPS